MLDGLSTVFEHPRAPKLVEEAVRRFFVHWGQGGGETVPSRHASDSRQRCALLTTRRPQMDARAPQRSAIDSLSVRLWSERVSKERATAEHHANAAIDASDGLLMKRLMYSSRPLVEDARPSTTSGAMSGSRPSIAGSSANSWSTAMLPRDMKRPSTRGLQRSTSMPGEGRALPGRRPLNETRGLTVSPSVASSACLLPFGSSPSGSSHEMSPQPELVADEIRGLEMPPRPSLPALMRAGDSATSGGSGSGSTPLLALPTSSVGARLAGGWVLPPHAPAAAPIMSGGYFLSATRKPCGASRSNHCQPPKIPVMIPVYPSPPGPCAEWRSSQRDAAGSPVQKKSYSGIRAVSRACVAARATMRPARATSAASDRR